MQLISFARYLAEETAKREELEKLQREQQRQLEEEQLSRQELEAVRQQQEEELKTAQEILDKILMEREEADKQMRVGDVRLVRSKTLIYSILSIMFQYWPCHSKYPLIQCVFLLRMNFELSL